jgi:ribosome modulation factor
MMLPERVPYRAFQPIEYAIARFARSPFAGRYKHDIELCNYTAWERRSYWLSLRDNLIP